MSVRKNWLRNCEAEPLTCCDAFMLGLRGPRGFNQDGKANSQFSAVIAEAMRLHRGTPAKVLCLGKNMPCGFFSKPDKSVPEPTKTSPEA